MRLNIIWQLRNGPTVALLLVALFAAACQAAGGTAPPTGGGLSVVTTIHPMEYFAERVGGVAVTVVNLVSPGVEAHGFEPSAGDLRTLGAADLVIANGLALEPWLDDALTSLGDEAPLVVIEAAGAIEGHGAEHDEETHEDEDDEHDHEGLDPHVWLDPLGAVTQVERIRDALITLAPELEAEFEANAGVLIEELEDLHQRASVLGDCAHDHFVTSHAAYGHLAARYGLEQVALVGLSVEAEPSAQRLAQIADQVRDLGLRYILVEPALGTRLADAVRRETGVELLPIHQIESVTPAELSEHGDYLGLMEDNLRSLSTALECGS